MSLSDIEHAKDTLHEIATHAYNLAMGLQNVAPAQAQTGNTIQYLKEIAIKLENASKKIETLEPPAQK